MQLCDLHILCYTVYTLSKTQIKSDNGFIYKYSFLNGRIIVIFYLHSLGKKVLFDFLVFMCNLLEYFEFECLEANSKNPPPG